MSDIEFSVDGNLRRAVAMAEHKGWRLDRFLAAALPDLSRSRLKALIEAGAVTHTRKTIRDGNWRVKPGEAYAVHIPPAAPALPQSFTRTRTSS
jgi:23S rRNA pseudouridine1911/1915/1917 synthase